MTRPQNSPLKNLREGRTAAHRRLRVDLIVLAVLLFALGVMCGRGFVQGVVVGALLMFLPRLWTDVTAFLDVEVMWDRFGAPPRKRKGGRHHSGHHPRPGARNQG